MKQLPEPVISNYAVYSARRLLANGEVAERENFIKINGKEYRLSLVELQPASTNLIDRWLEKVSHDS